MSGILGKWLDKGMQGSRINGMGYVADPFPHLGLAYHLIAERLANSQTVQRFCILFKKKKDDDKDSRQLVLSFILTRSFDNKKWSSHHPEPNDSLSTAAEPIKIVQRHNLRRKDSFQT